MTNRRTFLAQAAALGSIPGMTFGFRAHAQSMDRSKILCGFPAGGTSDAVSRRIAEKLRGNFASEVVVENRPGAAGQLAILELRDSPADGSVMLLTPSSMLSIYPYVYKSLPYKPLVDVQPVSVAAYFNHALGVGPAVPASVKTVDDFLIWCKANPEKAKYGSPGPGTMPHLIVTMMNILTGQNLRHVAYRGSAPGIQDLLAGKISAMSSPVGDYLQHIKTGKLRLLAVSGLTRSSIVPDVPTYRDQGIPVTVREWYGVFLPGKASAETVYKAAASLQPVLAQPELVSALAQLGLEAQSSTPSGLAEQLRNDATEWRRIIKYINFTPES